MPENKVQITLEAVDQTKDALGGVESKFASLQKGLLKFAAAGAAVYGAVKAVSAFIDAATEAEQIESRMAFQIGQAGYKFQEIKPLVDDFANSIQKTTRFSDELARQGLGQMMQYTTDVEQGMQGVKLAMDMSTQSGQDLGSTSRLVGMAMSGNVEVLGRWVPELRDLDSKLGANATSAEKAAYAIKVLNEKFGGAAQKDLETYGGQVASLANQYDDLKESLGKLLTPLAKFAVGIASRTVKAAEFIVSGPQVSEEAIEKMSGIESEAKIRARQTAAIAAAAKAYADDLANWKAKQEQRQGMNFQFAVQEWTLKKNTMALIDAQEWMALEKAKKIGADLNQIRTVFHQIRLDQIKKEKEEEFNALSSLSAMWKSHYDDRISKENEIIGLIKASGVETTIGAKFEFANVEEQFRKISEKAAMFTSEEFEKMKEVYTEKLKGILPWSGGEWEDSPFGERWKAGMMGEQERRIEQMREASIGRIQGMGMGAEFGRPDDIIQSFDQIRDKALELEQTLEAIKDKKLQIDTSKLIDAIGDIDETKRKLIDLISGDYKITVGVEIVGEELIRNLESRLADRWGNGRSGLRSAIEGE